MKLSEYKMKILEFFKQRNWYDYHIFIRTNFLTEEVGELCQIIRKIEIGRDRPDEVTATSAANHQELKEELGDILNNVIIIAEKYDITFDEIYEASLNKIDERFPSK